MSDNKYDIFISYRREGGAHYARILKAELEKRGYMDRVFLDYDELLDGKFDNRIMKAIESAPVFIFILSPGSLDRCINVDDWVRQEIMYAFKYERHIIPINFDGLFPGFSSKIPNQIKNILGQHQFSKIDSEQLLSVSIDKLINERIAPIVSPNNSDRSTHGFGAEVFILPDSDCEIYRFGKLIGRAKANSELIINLVKGNHLLEFVSIENPAVREKQKYYVPDNDYSDYIEVKLKALIDKTSIQKCDIPKNHPETKNSYNLILTNAGKSKLQVVKFVKEITGLGLKEAKELVDSVPSVILSNLSEANAKSIQYELINCGASAEILCNKNNTTLCSVILTDAGKSKLQVVKFVKEITGLGLKEAKELVDSVPSVILSNLSEANAKSIQYELINCGASAEILCNKNNTTLCSVILTDAGKSKLQVVKFVKEITGLGLKEAKELVDHTPSVILSNIAHSIGTNIVRQLETMSAAAIIYRQS